MRKLLLIGKTSELLKQLGRYLAKYFHTQSCSDHADSIEGMIKLSMPDIILLDLKGFNMSAVDIFSLLSNHYDTIPVITIGSQKEKELFGFFYEETQFQFMEKPLDNSDILNGCCNRLHIDLQDVFLESARRTDERQTILLVDDNALSLRNMKNMLSKYYQVTLAVSGLQAITSIGRQRPDLIILDYDMPVCDGRMTLEMLRDDVETREIPVIFLTGIADKEHIEAVLRLKPAGYFLKPPVEEKLLQAIRDIIG